MRKKASMDSEAWRAVGAVLVIVLFFSCFVGLGMAMHQPSPSHSPEFWQHGKRVETIGGRPGTVVDCRIQDNVVNEEAYVTVKFDDDQSVKELHWSRFK